MSVQTSRKERDPLTVKLRMTRSLALLSRASVLTRRIFASASGVFALLRGLLALGRRTPASTRTTLAPLRTGLVCIVVLVSAPAPATTAPRSELGQSQASLSRAAARSAASRLHPHIRTWMICYHADLPPEEVEFVAGHYDLLDGGRRHVSRLREHGSRAPVLEYLQFHNGMDDAPLHDSLYVWCERESLNVETMFLHFRGDVACWPRYEEGSRVIRGWGEGSAPAESLARVPVDWWGSRMYNVGDPGFRALFARFCRGRMEREEAGNRIDGFMFDNGFTRLSNTVNYLHRPGYPDPPDWTIAEYADPATRDSLWAAHMVVLVEEVRDSLAAVSRPVHLSLNCIGSIDAGWQPHSWYWAYRLSERLDSVLLEYFIEWDGWFVEAFADRVDSLTAAGAAVLVHAAGAPPEHEWCERSRLYDLALYYLLAHDSIYWGYTSRGYGARPSRFNWFGAVGFDVGKPVGPRRRVKSGGDWTLWEREYENARVLVRTRTSSGDFDAAPIAVRLDGPHRQLRSDGMLGEPAVELVLRNNEGALLVKVE